MIHHPHRMQDQRGIGQRIPKDPLQGPAGDGERRSDERSEHHARCAYRPEHGVLLLAEGKKDLARSVRQLATRVDGLAMLGSASIPEGVVMSLHGSKPVVLIAGDEHPGVEAIGAENVHSAQELTAHLIGHGRQRLLFVGDPDASPDIRDRYHGFVLAHEGSGRAAAEPTASGAARSTRPSPM